MVALGGGAVSYERGTPVAEGTYGGVQGRSVGQERLMKEFPIQRRGGPSDADKVLQVYLAHKKTQPRRTLP